MALVIGIDEAGFGPMLGPLVISGVALRVSDELAKRSLWETLRSSCCKTFKRSERRLVIADSKQLYKSRPDMHSLTLLERAAHVTLRAMGHDPTTWHEWLSAVAPASVNDLAEYPWYRAGDPILPLADDVGDLNTRSNALRRDLLNNNVEFLKIECKPLLEGQYNRLVAQTRNKAVVLLSIVLRLMDRLMRSTQENTVHVFVDRLGGRVRYREALMLAFSGADLRILEESPVQSRYRLTGGRGVCEITFQTEGEKHHFPVALASIFSKYLRELYMHAFNSYWSKQLDGLKPTAGYYNDAQRWLNDATVMIDRLRIDRRQLVRLR